LIALQCYNLPHNLEGVTATSKQTNNLEDIMIKFTYKLLVSLPMDDNIFVARLLQSGLLPGDTKTKMRSLSTTTEKVDYFIDNVILPNVAANGTALQDLILVIENGNYYFMNKLLSDIKDSLLEASSDAGEY